MTERISRPRLAAIVLVSLVALGAGCDDDPTLPVDAPEGHTVSQGGVAHMPGLRDPETSCVTCHGQEW